VRAMERVTLRHKTVGKWAKGAAKSKNPIVKQQLQDAHTLGQELKKKIDRIESQSSDTGSDEEDEASSEEDEEAPTKGLYAMKFMQRGQQQQRAEYEQLKKQFDIEQEERIQKLEIAAKKLRGEDVTEEVNQVKEAEKVPKTGRINFYGKSTQITTDARKQNKTKFVGGNYETEDVAMGGGFTSKVVLPITVAKAPPSKKETDTSTAPPNVFEIPEFPQVEIEEETQHSNTYQINQLPTLEVKNDKKRKRNSTKEKGGPLKERPEKAQTPKRGSEDKKGGENILVGVTKSPRGETQSVKKFVNQADNPWMKGDKDVEADSENKTQKYDKTSIPKQLGQKNDNKNQGKNKKIKKLADSQTVNLDLDRLEVRAEQVTQAKVTDKDQFNLIASATLAQKQLIQRAFANDNIETEFETEKKKEIEDQLPKEDLGLDLPGWGAWAGTGIEWKPTPKDVRKIKQREAKEARIQKARKDANLTHVIINQRKDIKVEKYKADKIPRPFKTREEYERSRRNPLGKDWNTNEIHKTLTKPRVSTQIGTVIDPIDKKIAKKQ